MGIDLPRASSFGCFQALQANYLARTIVESWLYTLRYWNKLRVQRDYFCEIEDAEISERSPELAAALIAERSISFEVGKFRDGIRSPLSPLNAWRSHLPSPKKVHGNTDDRRLRKLFLSVSTKVSKVEAAASGVHGTFG
ncbi:hypothetical protein ACPOL_0615 [Acidisarcina polymorpha]|uniref:Uncharacterized protein n=2 Tax=Acidisarcina polymorpha TaxID=2211140 RepID=A0A2Z5FU25_9BACT|nr:hypothetical protein ACPOL_0615 [Acidisarcina polymorpha]